MASPFTGRTKRGWNTGYLCTGHPAGSSPLPIAGLAMAMLSFTLVIRPGHHPRRQPRDSRIHPGNSGAGGCGQVAGAQLVVEKDVRDSG